MRRPITKRTTRPRIWRLSKRDTDTRDMETFPECWSERARCRGLRIRWRSWQRWLPAPRKLPNPRPPTNGNCSRKECLNLSRKRQSGNSWPEGHILQRSAQYFRWSSSLKLRDFESINYVSSSITVVLLQMTVKSLQAQLEAHLNKPTRGVRVQVNYGSCSFQSPICSSNIYFVENRFSRRLS